MAWVKIPKENHALFYARLPKDKRIQTLQMFGAAAAKVNGHLFGGLFARSFMVKLSDADHAEALTLDGAERFDPMGTGRVMSNSVLMPESLMDEPDEMMSWLRRAFDYTSTLPPKKAKTTKPKPTTSKPTTSKPKPTKPTTSKPKPTKPTTSKPTKPTTSKPTTSKNTKPTSKPTTSKPTTSKPTTSEPTTTKPTTTKNTNAKATKPTTTKNTNAKATKPTTTKNTKSTTTKNTNAKPTPTSQR